MPPVMPAHPAAVVPPPPLPALSLRSSALAPGTAGLGLAAGAPVCAHKPIPNSSTLAKTSIIRFISAPSSSRPMLMINTFPQGKFRRSLDL